VETKKQQQTNKKNKRKNTIFTSSVLCFLIVSKSDEIPSKYRSGMS